MWSETMKMKTLEDLFHHELKDLYSAEKQILKALPKMIKSCTSDDLRAALENHREETEEQVKRLDQIFEHLNLPTRGPKCKAMEGLIEEGKEMLEEDMEDQVRDAAIIAACQRVEHYEIAGYGCARTFAEMCGQTNAVELLQQTLNEEKGADEKLNSIAMEHVNLEAVGA